MIRQMGLLSELRTERLLLRRWTSADREPFAAMNADPEVMKYFPAVLPREESDRLAERIEEHFAVRGFGAWAVPLSGGLFPMSGRLFPMSGQLFPGAGRAFLRPENRGPHRGMPIPPAGRAR
jgi:hypothetical protein